MPDPTPAEPQRPDRSPDAVMLPAGLIAGSSGERANRIQARFGPILKARRVYCRNMATFNFLTGDPLDTIFHPKDHERSGQHRYDWFPAPDDATIKYGYLTEAPTTDATPQ